MGRKRFNDMNCGVAQALEALGDWWTLLIVRDAFFGARRFGEFERSLGIAKNILSARLQRLVEHGIFERVDVRPAIEQAIKNLPEPHHSVLVLIDLEEHSYEEAATILGLPIGTVRSRLFRARRIIQQTLIAHAQDAGLATNREQGAIADPIPS